MTNHLKLLSLAAALCGALACSSSDNGTTSGTGGGPGTTGSSTSAGGSTSAAGGSPTATGGNTSAGSNTGTGAGGGNTSGGTSTGGTTTGGSGLTAYPCIDGGPAYMPTNPPNSLPFCWCNPTKATGPQAYYQIINGCPNAGSTPDTTIPPVGSETITGLSAANLPLVVDAGIPGFVPAP